MFEAKERITIPFSSDRVEATSSTHSGLFYSSVETWGPTSAGDRGYRALFDVGLIPSADPEDGTVRLVEGRLRVTFELAVPTDDDGVPLAGARPQLVAVTRVLSEGVRVVDGHGYIASDVEELGPYSFTALIAFGDEDLLRCPDTAVPRLMRVGLGALTYRSGPPADRES